MSVINDGLNTADRFFVVHLPLKAAVSTTSMKQVDIYIQHKRKVAHVYVVETINYLAIKCFFVFFSGLKRMMKHFGAKIQSSKP